MFELGLTVIVFVLFVAYWWARQATHERRLSQYKIRVHVNGIRGKSTVTRLIAGVLREAGYKTLAKTTGSAAVTINLDGADVPLPRTGAVNVKEQQDVIAAWEPIGAEALVVECMALQPKYQEWAEQMVIQAHIGVITNVREDHQDVMGETLLEIAASMAHMCPSNGVLITAEPRADLQAVLRREAEKRGSRLIVADPAQVRDDEVAGFDYLSFKDNIAIGLAVAELLGIERASAMRGMVQARGDVGVVRLQRARVRGKPVIWANLFAVNDRESMMISMQVLEANCTPTTVKIGILNNRYDRERRAEQFGDVAVKDLRFDWLITFGAYESLVTQRVLDNGFPRDRIVNLGFSANPGLEQILDAIAAMIPDEHDALLVGFVNIHTPQAEMMMSHFEGLAAGRETDAGYDQGWRDVGYQRRQRFETSHA